MIQCKKIAGSVSTMLHRLFQLSSKNKENEKIGYYIGVFLLKNGEIKIVQTKNRITKKAWSIELQSICKEHSCELLSLYFEETCEQKNVILKTLMDEYKECNISLSS